MRSLAILSITALVALSACATSSSGPTLAQIQQGGNQFVSTLKTDVALYESQAVVPAADQAKITLALNALSAANVVLQGLTPSTSPTALVGDAQALVAAAVAVVNALPSGTLSPQTVQEIDAAGLAFQLAAGLAQQAISATAASGAQP